MPSFRSPLFAATIVAACVAVTGCSVASDAPRPEQSPQVLDEASPPASAAAPAAEVTCDAVAVAVAPYIDGLVPRPDNSADAEGANCAWEAPEGTTDLAQIRSVGVSIEHGEQSPLTAAEVDQIGFEVVPDPEIEAAGGIAYTTSTATSAAGVIVTTVALPDVEIIVSGGAWDGFPSLDGPASVAVARSILGL